MFTGIIQTQGTVTAISSTDTNITFTIQSTLSAQLQIDQSVAHNGVCLTVVACDATSHQVTAIAETLQKTTLGTWAIGTIVNLELAMQNNARLDGHFVQGHVDATMQCIDVQDKTGSWQYTFSFQPQFAALVIEKGSICINGISLTCFAVTESTLQVAIIPYTYQHTNIHQLMPNSLVNTEFDILGKYIARHALLNSKN